MRRCWLLFFLSSFAMAQRGPLPAGQAAEGWIRLFDGETLYGWTNEGGVVHRIAEGVLTLEPGTGWLRSFVPFGDFEMHLEYQAGGPVDSGVFLRLPPSGPPTEAGLEIQLAGGDAAEWPPGSIMSIARARRGRVRTAGEWLALDITVRGSSVIVRRDGREVANARVFRLPAGHIGLQAPAGGEISIRDLRIRPTGLAPLLNGRDLRGWRAVDPPRRTQPPAEWSVREGMLHVQKGPGQLETEKAWDDFILQAELRMNTVPPAPPGNSGIFFRGDPGVFWSGYEAQIRNEFQSDPRKVVDFGTGGLYGRQPARAIVALDAEWFTMTLVAAGRRIAVWVNGYQVTEYQDDGPEGTVVREGKARLARGTISLQAHDSGTNLDVRQFQLAPLPRLAGN